MLIIRNLNLISGFSWTYLAHKGRHIIWHKMALNRWRVSCWGIIYRSVKQLVYMSFPMVTKHLNHVMPCTKDLIDNSRHPLLPSTIVRAHFEMAKDVKPCSTKTCVIFSSSALSPTVDNFAYFTSY